MKKTEKSDAHYKKIFPKYRQIFKIITSKKFGLKFKNPVCYDEPVLILCNHTNDFDFMVVSAMFKMHAYAMCSQHVLGIKFLGKLVETKLNPIAVYKGSDKSSYVMEMVRRIRRGNSVLLFAEGHQFRNAGVLIILEIQAQDLLQGVAGAEGLGIDRKDPRIHRAKLSVKIDADRHAFDVAYTAGELLKALVQLGIILALDQGLNVLL